MYHSSHASLAIWMEFIFVSLGNQRWALSRPACVVAAFSYEHLWLLWISWTTAPTSDIWHYIQLFPLEFIFEQAALLPPYGFFLWASLAFPENVVDFWQEQHLTPKANIGCIIVTLKLSLFVFLCSIMWSISHLITLDEKCPHFDHEGRGKC